MNLNQESVPKDTERLRLHKLSIQVFQKSPTGFLHSPCSNRQERLQPERIKCSDQVRFPTLFSENEIDIRIRFR